MDNAELGLAQHLARANSGIPEKASSMPTIEEIAAMLMQGITPEELHKAGVPLELIQEAVRFLQAQMQKGAMGAKPSMASDNDGDETISENALPEESLAHRLTMK